MLRRIIHEEDVMALNTYRFKHRAPKYRGINPKKLKKETDNQNVIEASTLTCNNGKEK